MKLETADRSILNALRLNADLELSSLARLLKMTERKVRYTFELLLRRGIVSRSNFFDMYPLGLRSINVYFTLATAPKKVTDQLIAHLAQMPEVTFLAELGGEYHYCAAFALERYEQVATLFGTVPKQLTAAIHEKRYSSHTTLKMYPLRMLGNPVVEPPTLGYGASQSVCPLDDTGRLLLQKLVSTPHESLRDLSRQVGLVPSSLLSRINKLREAKVLRGSWLQVNFEMLGLHAYKLLIYSQNLSPETETKLGQFCSRHKNVDYLITCVGDWDFELGVIVESHNEVMQIVRSLYEELGESVRTVKTLPFLRMLKLRQIPAKLR